MYANFGLIPGDYGAFLFCLGLAGSAAGQVATQRLVRALRRRSVIVLLMALLVGGPGPRLVPWRSPPPLFASGGGWAWGRAARCRVLRRGQVGVTNEAQCGAF